MTTNQFVLAAGSPFAAAGEGVSLHGPFATADAAEDFALNSLAGLGNAWEVVPLVSLALDAALHGDGAADEESAATEALAVLVALSREYPDVLGARVRLGAMLAEELRQALAATPRLVEYLRRAVGSVGGT